MKYILLVSFILFSSTLFAQDLEKLLTDGEWQICDVSKDFKKLDHITFLKNSDEDPCGTWGKESIDREIKFKTLDNWIGYKEVKMGKQGMEETNGSLGKWKLNKKKKTIKFKVKKGTVTYAIEELTDKKLVLKKL